MRRDRANRVFIGIGSNIDPKQNILLGLNLLFKTEKVIGVSNFYRTCPIGMPGHPDFWNGVVAIETTHPPWELKYCLLREIESACGRIRTTDPYTPRTLDFDIVLYGGKVIRKTGLCIPDPDIRSRPFIAVPVFEIDPNVIVPDTGESISDIIGGMDTSRMEPLVDFNKLLQNICTL